MNPVKRYILNWLLWLDQGANCLLGGDPQETLSSRIGKVAADGHKWAVLVCKVLDWLDPGHCQRSVDQYDGWRAIWRW